MMLLLRAIRSVAFRRTTLATLVSGVCHALLLIGLTFIKLGCPSGTPSDVTLHAVICGNEPELTQGSGEVAARAAFTTSTLSFSELPESAAVRFTVPSMGPSATPAATTILDKSLALWANDASLATSAFRGPAIPWMERYDTGGSGSRGRAGTTGAKGSPGGYTSFFGVKAPGKRFVYVVDVSGSMEGQKFRRARNELRRSIEALSETQQYFVIFFSTDAIPMPSDGMLRATKTNLAKTAHWVKQIHCRGNTDPLPGLLIALDFEPDAVYLLTDGKFDPTVVGAVAQVEADQPIPIHTIGFTDQSGEPLLRELARLSGGTYRFVQ